MPDANGLTVLHRVRASSRLVPWKVAAVTSIAACPDGSVFAAGYDDGKVEIYDAELFNVLAVSLVTLSGCSEGVTFRGFQLPFVMLMDVSMYFRHTVCIADHVSTVVSLHCGAMWLWFPTTAQPTPALLHPDLVA